MTYEIGQRIIAPRGGEEVIVAKVLEPEYPGTEGTVVATTDGGDFGDYWCRHDAPVQCYFEYLTGPYRGTHGWYDGAKDCRKVFQVG
jgi:hypothetical protein